MRRREFLQLTAGTAMTWPFAARAQQKPMPVVGYLLFSPADPIAGPAPTTGAFHDGLNEAGYVVGQNVAIEFRWAEDHYDRLPALAADLVRRKVDVIVTNAGTPGALAAKTATGIHMRRRGCLAPKKSSEAPTAVKCHACGENREATAKAKMM